MRLNMEKLAQVLLLPDEDMLSLEEVMQLMQLSSPTALWKMVKAKAFPHQDQTARFKGCLSAGKSTAYWHVSTFKKYLGVVA